MLVQTPIEVHGHAVLWHCRRGRLSGELGALEETHFGTNIGGGAKIKLLGPLRVRLDYRIFRLQGAPIHDDYQRFYVGANLKF